MFQRIETGSAIGEVAKEYNISRGVVEDVINYRREGVYYCDISRPLGRKLTEREIQQIIDLKKSDVPLWKIGMKLNRSEATISRCLQKFFPEREYSGYQSIGYLTIAAFSGLTQIFENIRIPDGVVDLGIDVYNPEYMEVIFPYYIKNQGMYDLTDLFIEVDISVNYTDLITRENLTVQVFSKTGSLPDCKAFSSLIGYFNGTFNDFNITTVIEFLENVDHLESIKFFMDISFQVKYFWTLISFSLFLDDVRLA